MQILRSPSVKHSSKAGNWNFLDDLSSSSPFECIPDNRSLWRGKKNGGAVDFRSPERLSDNRTMSYGSLSHRKQGGMYEIHLFGIHGARKIRRDDRGRAARSVRRML